MLNQKKIGAKDAFISLSILRKTFAVITCVKRHNRMIYILKPALQRAKQSLNPFNIMSLE